MGQYTEERRRKAEEIAQDLRKKFGCIEQILLYGSVARGTDNGSSDTDLLCLYSNEFPLGMSGTPQDLSAYVWELESRLMDQGYDVEINLKSADRFETALSRGDAFARNVERDKVVLHSWV